jgi:hypothetical protein
MSEYRTTIMWSTKRGCHCSRSSMHTSDANINSLTPAEAFNKEIKQKQKLTYNWDRYEMAEVGWRKLFYEAVATLQTRWTIASQTT